MHFLQSVMEPSSAPPSQKERTEPPEAKSIAKRLSSSVKDLTEDRAPKCTESFVLRTLDLTPSF